MLIFKINCFEIFHEQRLNCAALTVLLISLYFHLMNGLLVDVTSLKSLQSFLSRQLLDIVDNWHTDQVQKKIYKWCFSSISECGMILINPFLAYVFIQSKRYKISSLGSLTSSKRTGLTAAK